eukprot:scaffold21672_cov47-Phaeocystis_antarctica.AAC.1
MTISQAWFRELNSSPRAREISATYCRCTARCHRPSSPTAKRGAREKRRPRRLARCQPAPAPERAIHLL